MGVTFVWLSVCVLLLSLLSGVDGVTTLLPGMTRFVFTSDDEKTLNGRTSAVCPEPFDDAQISLDDTIGTIAIVTLRHLGDGFDSGNCEQGPRYSHAQYPAQMGTVSSVGDMIVNGTATAYVNHEAYNISAPLVRATDFSVSPRGIFFKPTHGNISYDVYTIDENGFVGHILKIAQSTVESAWGKNAEGVTYDDMYFTAGTLNKTLNGRTSTACPNLDDATIAATDMIGDFAIVKMPYAGGSCWTNEGYSDADYPAQVGTLLSSTNAWGNITFENTLSIDSPQISATEFAAGDMNLFFKPTYGNTSYSIWIHDGDAIDLIGTVTKENVEASWGKNLAPLTAELDFEYETNKTIHGRTSKICPEPYDDATIDEQDILGDIALVTLRQDGFSSGSCWTNEGYSDADYPVTMGTLRSTTLSFSFAGSFRVDEPLVRATVFRASQHAIFFRPSHGNVTYSVYAYDGSSVTELSIISRAQVEASAGKNGGFVYSNVNVDSVLGVTAFIQPASVHVFDMLNSQYRGFVNSGVRLQDLYGKTTFVRPSSFDVHSILRPDRGYMVYSGLNVDDVEGKVFFFTPASELVSSFPRWSTGVEAIIDSNAGWFSALERRFELPDSIQRPFDPLIDWTEGPANWYHKYSTSKRFNAVRRNVTDAGLQDGVVFQDESSQKIFVSWVVQKCEDVETLVLDTDGAVNGTLYGATSDGVSRIFYFVVDTSNVDKELPYDAATNAASAKLICANAMTGAIEYVRTLDTSGDGFNIRDLSSPAGSLSYRPAGTDSATPNATLGMLWAMGYWNDHQGAKAATFDADTFETLRVHGQTSGHSFANRLGVSNDGSMFVGVDLGDNFPRGIHLHQFDATSKQSKVVYNFKTKHATTIVDMIDVDHCADYANVSDCIYTEISNANETYYRWSNDNNVYTDITQVVQVGPESGDGYLVFFAGERRPLDSTQVGSSLNNPRNVGLIRLRSDVFAVTNVTEAIVRMQGDGSSEPEFGGFYNYGGTWSEQRNDGILWLTSFGSPPDEGSVDLDENVVRLRAAHLGTNKNLVIFEVWTGTTYLRTMLMLVADDGTVAHGPTECPLPMRLGPADELVVVSASDGVANIAVGYSGVAGSPSNPAILVRYDIMLNVTATADVNDVESSEFLDVSSACRPGVQGIVTTPTAATTEPPSASASSTESPTTAPVPAPVTTPTATTHTTEPLSASASSTESPTTFSVSTMIPMTTIQPVSTHVTTESSTMPMLTTPTSSSTPTPTPQGTIVLEGAISLTLTIVNCNSASEMAAMATVLIAAVADQFSTIDTSNFEVVSITCTSRRVRNRHQTRALSSRSVAFEYRFSLPTNEATARQETANTWQGYLGALDDAGQASSLANAIVVYASQNVAVATQDATSIESSVSVSDVSIVSEGTEGSNDDGDDGVIIYASIGAGAVVAVALLSLVIFFTCMKKRPAMKKTTAPIEPGITARGPEMSTTMHEL